MAGTREMRWSVLGNRFDAGAAPATVTEYDRQYASSDLREVKTTVSQFTLMGRTAEGRSGSQETGLSQSAKHHRDGKRQTPLRGAATSKSLEESVSTCWKLPCADQMKMGSG
jgi:hypothetical protein